jgi:hypothetical protein
MAESPLTHYEIAEITYKIEREELAIAGDARTVRGHLRRVQPPSS